MGKQEGGSKQTQETLGVPRLPYRMIAKISRVAVSVRTSRIVRRSYVQLMSVHCVPSHFSRVRLLATLDGSPPGSSVHGILQARILEWVAVHSSRGSSRPRDRIRASCVSCIAGRFFTAEPPEKPLVLTIPPRKILTLTNICQPLAWVYSVVPCRQCGNKLSHRGGSKEEPEEGNVQQ